MKSRSFEHDRRPEHRSFRRRRTRRRLALILTRRAATVKPRELLALVVLAALWGGSFLFIRVAVPSFGPAALVGTRVALAAVVLALVALVLREPFGLRVHAGRLLVLGGLNAALPMTLISAAELQLTASLAAVLNATTPLFAALLSVVWMREPLTLRRASGLAVGFVGVGIMVGWSPMPLTRATMFGVFAMLVSSASYAAAGIYTRRTLAGVPSRTLALGQQVGALAWLAVPSLFTAPRTAPPASAIGAVAALGVVSTAVGYLLYFPLIARVGPTKTSTVTYVVPAFGMLWGALFLHERLTWGMAAGFVFVLVSVLFVNEVRLPRPRVALGGGTSRA